MIDILFIIINLVFTALKLFHTPRPIHPWKNPDQKISCYCPFNTYYYLCTEGEREDRSTWHSNRQMNSLAPASVHLISQTILRLPDSLSFQYLLHLTFRVINKGYLYSKFYHSVLWKGILIKILYLQFQFQRTTQNTYSWGL